MGRGTPPLWLKVNFQKEGTKLPLTSQWTHREEIGNVEHIGSLNAWFTRGEWRVVLGVDSSNLPLWSWTLNLVKDSNVTYKFKIALYNSLCK